MAEIFNRYYPDDIEMYSIDNGKALDKRKNNWEFLQRFFNKRNIPFKYADYDGVMHKAPKAGYEFLKRLYTLFKGKTIEDTPSAEQFDVVPDYAKPTIAAKVKDSELVRIKDTKTLTDKATDIISEHNEMLRTERLNPNRYTKTKTGFGRAKYTEMASAKVLSQKSKTKKSTYKPDMTEISQQNLVMFCLT